MFLVRFFPPSPALSFAPYNCKLFFETYRSVDRERIDDSSTGEFSDDSGFRILSFVRTRVTFFSLVAIPSIGASSTPGTSLFGFISSELYSYRYRDHVLWLLTVAVNDYLMRYSPYTLRLMVYVTESILHAKVFSFQKIGKFTVIFFLCVLSFCPLL